MGLTEIYERLKSLGIPVAYLHFLTPQQLPFLVYFEAGGTVEGADNYNLFRRTRIIIEFYSAKKDIEKERKIEGLFREHELEKTADTFIREEKMFMTAWQFENIQAIEEE